MPVVIHKPPWYNKVSLAEIPWSPVRSQRTRSYITAQDWFCGLGGTAQALLASGVEVKVSGNHDAHAIENHAANFPGVEHVQADIRGVDVVAYPTTDIGVFTSECTFLTNANPESSDDGQLLLWDDVQPDDQSKAERSRSLMNEVLRFTDYHRYSIVFVENVIGIFRWKNFNWWLGEMRKMGYVDHAIVHNSQFSPNYPCPVPQSRERYYGVFVRPDRVTRMPNLDIRPDAHCIACNLDIGAVQSWKKPNRKWGLWDKSYVYRCPYCSAEVRPFFSPAASAIDWSLPTTAIGERIEQGKKPLEATTMARIKYGIEKFGRPLVYDTAFSYGGSQAGYVRAADSEPLATQTGRQTFALATPFMADLRGTQAQQLRASSYPLTEPVSTVCASGMHHLLATPPGAFTVQYYKTGGSTDIHEPIPTITGHDRHGLVVPPQSFTVQYYGRDNAASPTSEPIPTITGAPRHALVSAGETPRLEDWRTRMLDPQLELKIMMGFPKEYIVTGTKRQQTGLIGRSLAPATVADIIRRCVEVL